MKKLFVIAILALVAGWVLRAQITIASPSIIAIPSTALAVGCAPPSAGFTIYCTAADKFQVSANGAPYVVIWPAGATVAGVTSLAVNGGTPQTGAVALTIPTKVSVTSTAALQ